MIRYFLERSWGSQAIDEGLWQNDLLTTRQLGAEHAPLHLLPAGLFSVDIHTRFDQLQLPAGMSHGPRGDLTDDRGRGFVQQRPNRRVSIYPTGALPYFMLPAQVCADLGGCLANSQGAQR